jgi:hypothetical protein
VVVVGVVVGAVVVGVVVGAVVVGVVVVGVVVGAVVVGDGAEAGDGADQRGDGASVRDLSEAPSLAPG